MNPLLPILLLLCLALFSCINHQKEEKENIFVNEEEIPAFLEEGLLKGMSLNGHVYIDDTAGIKRINIPIINGFSHEYWDFVVGYTTFYELVRNDYICKDVDTLFYLSIIYDIPDQNRTTFSCFPSEEFEDFHRFPRYYTYCKYVVANMWPEDFEVYDWAMQDLYEEYENELFNRSFSDFFRELSADDYLFPEEKYVLDKLIEWTEAREDYERLKPFEYFLQSFDNIILEDDMGNIFSDTEKYEFTIDIDSLIIYPVN